MSLTALLSVCLLGGAGGPGHASESLDVSDGQATSVVDVAATARPELLTAADRRSFDRLARSLGGDSGVAVSPMGIGQRARAAGTFRGGVAWSTAKVPVAMAVIAAGDGASPQADLRQAITASDNAAAERLWSSLGTAKTAAARTTDQLRAAGDRRTVVQSKRLRPGFTAFGQSSWRLTDQARFMAGLPCVTAGESVLALMGQIIPAHRWGLGATNGKAEFKGGWGPGNKPGAAGGYVDRQMGVLTLRGKSLAVAIATAPANGSHKTGAKHLTRIARWLVVHVAVRGLSAKPSCS